MKYTFNGYIHLLRSLLYTKIFYKKSRIIRMPVDIRHKKRIDFGTCLTTGKFCRIEATEGNGKSLYFGDQVQINDFVHITAKKSVTIGDNVLIASKVYISDCTHGCYSPDNSSSPYTPPEDRELFAKPVVIEKNVWIGENVCVLPGSHIGFGSIIGANSLVNSKIPPLTISVGSPARVIKKYNLDLNVWEKVKS
jgi:lipopolysaccharide O-acetyltransferase